MQRLQKKDFTKQQRFDLQIKYENFGYSSADKIQFDSAALYLRNDFTVKSNIKNNDKLYTVEFIEEFVEYIDIKLYTTSLAFGSFGHNFMDNSTLRKELPTILNIIIHCNQVTLQDIFSIFSLFGYNYGIDKVLMDNDLLVYNLDEMLNYYIDRFIAPDANEDFPTKEMSVSDKIDMIDKYVYIRNSHTANVSNINKCLHGIYYQWAVKTEEEMENYKTMYRLIER